MFRQLKFRDRLAVMAAAPLLVAAAVATTLFLLPPTADTTTAGLIAVGGLLATGGLCYLVGRSIMGSLQELIDGSSNLADAHRRLAKGELTVAELKPLTITSGDVLGQVAAAVNAVNAATVELNESQRGAVKAGLSNIVVNLARRSQTLLDRQVEYLDRLESSEEDPDRLGELFKVDHLATRMRRNAESLLVLAEADPGRRRGGPVEIGDVLRVAMGEVESYQHIELHDVDEGRLNATAAVDLAHLTAELMENATQFSPPNTPVQVTGKFGPSGGFVVSIVDQGIGFTTEKLADSNQLLANPPELGLGMGRSLGFMVIGRLAERLNATVSLESGGETGSKAVVVVPGDLFVGPNPAPDAPTLHESKTDAAVAESPTAGPVPGPLALSTPAPKPARPAVIQPAAPVSGNGSAASAAGNGSAARVSGNGSAAPVSGNGSAAPAVTVPADTGQPAGSTPSALERLLGIGAQNDPDPEPMRVETPLDWASTSPFGTTPLPVAEPAEAEPAPAPASPASNGSTPSMFDGKSWPPVIGAAATDATTPTPQTAGPAPTDPAHTTEAPQSSPERPAGADPVSAVDSATDAPAPIAPAPIAPAPVAPAPSPAAPIAPAPIALNPIAPAPIPAAPIPTAPIAPSSSHGTAPDPTASFPAPPAEFAAPVPPGPEADPWQQTNRWPDQSRPSENAEGGAWSPPEVTAVPPVGLEHALPSGDAFESGIASLLDGGPDATPDNGDRTLRGDATPSGLIKRRRGASHVPIGEGRPVASAGRNPDEVRSRLSRYREGLKGRKPSPPEHRDGSDGSAEHTDTRDR